MRKRIVAGNWKMNTSIEDGSKLAEEVSKLVLDLGNTDIGVAIAPPFTHLATIANIIDSEKVCLAAQNCASEESGAYTGEVSASMLKKLGVDAVIIGHSERRSYFKEDHATLTKKVNLVLKHNMKLIFCCGEVLDERDQGIQNDIVKKQLEESLFHLSAEEMDNCRIAYEPVWAIGTGRTASPEQAQEMHAFIRSLVKTKYGDSVAESTTILYGGSCKPSNASELFSNPDVDGGLIGGAALKADDFVGIVKSF
ncbi:MAG: triose-phosphate isomerase [Bacteroidetes bacterium]|jgi:triosephosphate isomerase (TIM)|nr:triose-phosphate isomerase [Bacteroidota bacterium]MBT6046663.1 triose-phosphate isomerase [Candidatus Scalindua sp.]MBT4400803.1 triose-phosphate isomerase [Bacteroidota bacterium]MBT4410989.1 triose-phosphate isomerase [Bacteroidota bacterium]MBT7093738.1 triose-phosphate isomerase [Bacteroidota bacterium]